MERLETSNGAVSADGVVICAGIGSLSLLDKLPGNVKDNFPLLPVRGYSLTLPVDRSVEPQLRKDGYIHGTVFKNGKTRVSRIM